MKSFVKSSMWRLESIYLNVISLHVPCFLCARIGYTGRDGQSAVYFGGNSLEDLLEVQPESGGRCNISCVSANISDFNCFKIKETSEFAWRSDVKCPFWNLCMCVWISHDESEKRLPKSCLVLLCKYEPVLRWSRDCDNSLYQGLVEILIPDVLRPIPSKDV